MRQVEENVMGQPQKQVIVNLSPSPSSSPELEVLFALPSSNPEDFTKKARKSAIFNLLDPINSYRQNNGKSELVTSNAGCVFANERLYELQTNYSHNGFDEVLSKTGKLGAAENIARTSKNKGAGFVVNQMWAISAGHNKNMLGEWTEGCGYYDGKFAVFIFLR